MEKQVKESLYKKGKVYQHTDNSEYIVTKEYEPLEYTERVFNPVIETYEYVKKIKNDKLDWENEEQMLNQLEIIDKEIAKK